MQNQYHLEFKEIIEDIINTQPVQEMAGIHHHVKEVSCLDHCLFVAYLSYFMAKKLNLDYVSCARGGLLHDLHLTNWDENPCPKPVRWVIHPGIALDNAKKHYEVSKLEEDIISKHMWPVTITKMPKHRESAIVSLADKICAIYEVCGLYKKTKTKKQLNNYNHIYIQKRLYVEYN